MDLQNIQEIPIIQLIPQRPPFVMVDKVISFNITDAATVLRISEDNLFCDGKVFSSSGIIENMAQSCAARMGCLNLMKGDTVKIGFIGDIRNCDILRHPLAGETLTTHVHIIEDVFHLTLADVTVKVADETVARARMKIALMDTEASDDTQQPLA